jgi:anti-sigma regulatory factor (Ser/Thr protein kinase)
MSERFFITNQMDVRMAVSRAGKLEIMSDASEVDCSLVATIISELGSNIAKYAGRGYVSVGRIERSDGVHIEVTAEDSGPGIGDIAQAMQDHFSTGGTLGLGLPGVRRMADEFSIASQPGQGTRVYARKLIKGKRSAPPMPLTRAESGPAEPSTLADSHWDVACQVRPFPGEIRCGDAAVATLVDGGLLLAIIDASGHGDRAQLVSARLEECLHKAASTDIAGVMAKLHKSAQGSLGAAVGLAFVEPAQRRFRYLGVGNTRAVKLGREAWRGVSRDGVVGERFPTPFEQTVPLEADDCLILWTDGMSEHSANALPPAVLLHPAAGVACRLIADSARDYDDAGCVVMKWRT